MRFILPRQRFVLCACALAIIIGGSGLSAIVIRRRESVPTGWTDETIENLRYSVLLPQGYDPEIRYPVVLYLHQYLMGNSRPALLRQVDVWFGNPGFRARHPAIVVVPMVDQASDPGANFGGKRDGRSWAGAVLAALSEVRTRYSVDQDRIYITGNSMGAMGVWDMLLSQNAQTGRKGHIFAAGLPLAGRHQTANPVAAANVLWNVPIWAIHGGKDPEVSPDWDRSMAHLLSNSPTFRYTEDPKLKHDVWDSYYARPEVWDWLFAQRATSQTPQR